MQKLMILVGMDGGIVHLSEYISRKSVPNKINLQFSLTGWAVSYESSNPSEPQESHVEWDTHTMNKSDHSHLNPLVGQVVEYHDAHPIVTNSDDGYFHRTTATVNDNVIMCGNLSAG